MAKKRDRLQERINARGPITDAARLMLRTRATLCLANAIQTEAFKAAAFMELFHPNASDAVKRAVIQAGKDRDRRHG